MKTTIDLPSDLVRAFKLHAVHHGLKLNTTAVAILRATLEQQTPRAQKSLPKTLPLMPMRPRSAPRLKPLSAQEMSDFIKQADLEADAVLYEKAFGH